MSSVISTYGEIEFSSNIKVFHKEEKKQEISKKNYKLIEKLEDIVYFSIFLPFSSNQIGLCLWIEMDLILLNDF